ncbi:MAG: hypothetical protein Q9167_005322 [Letrouitia subvulpina]
MTKRERKGRSAENRSEPPKDGTCFPLLRILESEGEKGLSNVDDKEYPGCQGLRQRNAHNIGALGSPGDGVGLVGFSEPAIGAKAAQPSSQKARIASSVHCESMRINVDLVYGDSGSISVTAQSCG